jgi:glycine/D-amino acid oxidase-like deaminating enzyme
VNRRSALALLSAAAVKGIAKSDRVLIAGAGIIGASIAYHLAQRGANVTVLEKERPGAGATSKSFAWLNSFSKQPRSYYELNLLGMAGWRRLAAEIPELRVEWGGSVQWSVGQSAERLRRNVARLEQWGYAAHLIDPPELAKLLPGFTPGSFDAAAFADAEATVDPVEALGAILRAAQKMGARVEYPCEVTGISAAGGQAKSIDTTRGTFELDFLVLAAGNDTPRLARMVEVNVPLKESIGLLAHSAPASRLASRIAVAPGATIKQNPDGRIVTGTDFGNSETIDTSRAYGEKLLANAAQFLPGIREARLEVVTLGHRVMPKDDHPIVGFTGKCRNLYVAAMHSGMTLSPVIGQLAAGEILDGVSVDLLNDYRPARFA